ncbi:MAG: hypothetical protein IJ236_07645 [Oscillospiraceae bacterium]|nr:hypothetical protein [Oscillospiraceae bacterium]
MDQLHQFTDRSREIFGNEMAAGVIRKAQRTKEKYLRRFGDDSDKVYPLSAVPAPAIGNALGVQSLTIGTQNPVSFDEKSIVIGNIRMGFGHYRISMAMASAAHAMGYHPYWFDLCSFEHTTCGKIIAAQNDLYSLGSRLSQQSVLFNKIVWEPLNSEGFRKLSYNAADQKTAELMVPVYQDLPKEIPFIATHVWPAQAAIHAGLTNVVNAIPDNWPMALHLAEGSIHTVQTPSAYLGYRALRGMDKKRDLHPMPGTSICYTGHYVDHELVQNIDEDCRRRCARAENGKARRWLMSVGGAGAQKEIFTEIIRRLLPQIRRERAVLLINVGDHRIVWNELLAELPEMRSLTTEHFNSFRETDRFCREAYDGEISGIHVFCHSDIFAAVYSTNLLMRVSDVLITKPSELSFYPIPKLMIKRVGGHEAWGAIRAAELGDGTYECATVRETNAMLSLLQRNGDVIVKMCQAIHAADEMGLYSGAYRAVKLAVRGREQK